MSPNGDAFVSQENDGEYERGRSFVGAEGFRSFRRAVVLQADPVLGEVERNENRTHVHDG